MATIKIENDKKYGKAIRLLLDLGGWFGAKPDRQLVVGFTQIQALRAAGLIPAQRNGVKKRAPKKA